MSMLESKVEEKKDGKFVVNREKTCPLLLRVFCSNNRHNQVQDYRRGLTPPNELQIYTWMDATLKEISDLIMDINPDARRPGTVFDFTLIYPDLSKPIPKKKDLGFVTVGQSLFDDDLTLKDLGYIIGDFLDVGIMTPGPQRGMMQQQRRMMRNF